MCIYRYVCMYVCMYVYVYIYMCVCVYIYIYSQANPVLEKSLWEELRCCNRNSYEKASVLYVMVADLNCSREKPNKSFKGPPLRELLRESLGMIPGLYSLKLANAHERELIRLIRIAENESTTHRTHRTHRTGAVKELLTATVRSRSRGIYLYEPTTTQLRRQRKTFCCQALKNLRLSK